jgi:hypothetical protein
MWEGCDRGRLHISVKLVLGQCFGDVGADGVLVGV